MECVECLGKGVIVEREGDGQQGEVECYRCGGTGIEPYDPDSPDKERV